MNIKIKYDKMLVLFNGEKVNITNPAEFKVGTENIKDNGYFSFTDKELNFDLGEVKIEKCLDSLIQDLKPKFDITVNSLHLPKGNKLPKKKRIRKKWLKKYTYEKNYENCTINFKE